MARRLLQSIHLKQFPWQENHFHEHQSEHSVQLSAKRPDKSQGKIQGFYKIHLPVRPPMLDSHSPAPCGQFLFSAITPFHLSIHESKTLS
jgi:hypothetical protein